MTKNVGTIDKVIRIIIGIALLSLIFLLDGPDRWWGLIGIVPILTVLVGWCPIYSLLGVKTTSD